MNVLLSTTYFGPIQWYQKLYRADKVWIECHETFQKQTYRNRCVIATTQGNQALTVPVERSPLSPVITIKDLRISDHGNWRHLHWNAIQSAYGESPFFEYYQDDIRPFFEKRWDFLLDFNEAICEKMCELIDIQPAIYHTEEYIKIPSSLNTQHSTLNTQHYPVLNTRDFRDAIQPKHPAADPDFSPKPYYQVFRQKHGFLPNLSILDLLCNMGPESIFWL